jgi:hypothetical protein
MDRNFRMSASASKKRQSGSVGTVQSPQNTDALRQSCIRSLRRSARRCSVAPGISHRRVRRMLHKDLNFHQTKWWWCNRDMANYSRVAECLIGIFPTISLTLWEMKHRILTIVQRKIHSSSINGFFRVHAWLSRRPFFLWRRRWACSHSHICSLCLNVTELPHARTESSWNWALDRLVPARSCNCSYSKNIHGIRSGNVSGACHFTARRASMAYTFAWSLCLWLFPLGVLKAKVYITPPWTIDESQFERKFQRYQKTWRG